MSQIHLKKPGEVPVAQASSQEKPLYVRETNKLDAAATFISLGILAVGIFIIVAANKTHLFPEHNYKILGAELAFGPSMYNVIAGVGIVVGGSGAGLFGMNWFTNHVTEKRMSLHGKHTIEDDNSLHSVKS